MLSFPQLLWLWISAFLLQARCHEGEQAAGWKISSFLFFPAVFGLLKHVQDCWLDFSLTFIDRPLLMFPCSRYKVPAEERRYQDIGIKHLPRNQDIPSKLSTQCPWPPQGSQFTQTHSEWPSARTAALSNPTVFSDNAKNRVCAQNRTLLYHLSKQNLLPSWAERLKSVTDLLSTNIISTYDQVPSCLKNIL